MATLIYAAPCRAEHTAPATPEPKPATSGYVASYERGADASPPPVERSTLDLLRAQSGYVHPFLDVTAMFSDNVFNTGEDLQSDIVTVVTPGVWLVLPRKAGVGKEGRVMSLETSTLTPGGIKASRPNPQVIRHYQTYLMYSADMVYHSEFSDENVITHNLDLFAQYNTRYDITVEGVGMYRKGVDPRGTGGEEEMAGYQSTLAGLVVMYDRGYRFYPRLDVSYNVVDYTTETSSFRDRTDLSLGGYVFYRIYPKTAAFLQYQGVDIAYDDWYGSFEHHVYVGVDWEMTGRAKGIAKVGTGLKDFDDDSIDDRTFLDVEGQLSYTIDSRKSLILDGRFTTNESNVSTASHIYARSVKLTYAHKLGVRYNTALSLTYTNDQYDNFDGEDRDDTSYTAAAMIRFSYRRGVNVAAGYAFTTRDSNYDAYDFDANVLFVSLALGL